jgi:hypothetical protein
MAAPIRKRLFSIIGHGAGLRYHVHIDDAAAAVRTDREPSVSALEADPVPAR